ncbi:uncharacterized protein LOC127266622 [Andrographis paniculata]|uniref:uncharacterized protein LOC127266622 n=1 Tax=Andrographis paniculata TaxID=175694 RepID=UPI0021E7CD98|nr:uncharacterized protein LOC127266622 [Andrographis paniculata]XP_051152896.1 uncharacterized protein LOC127266622 [Andrographis paniculata]XP_051152897.1 uncharacterized protein LOC127266622 [Andrographis paniculata]XP_051152898.1 uncharacterized protein LOC127266622 [Andrographis paniculata]
MAFSLLRRTVFFTSITNPLLSSRLLCKFSSSKASTSIEQGREQRSVGNRLHLSPLITDLPKCDLIDCKIELVDYETWRVSSALADAWRGRNEDKSLKTSSSLNHGCSDKSFVNSGADFDFDSIEDMRIRGNLFYKLDKDSKEYEEYKFDFHGKKSSRNERVPKQSTAKSTELSKESTAKSKVMDEISSKKDHTTAIKRSKMESLPIDRDNKWNSQIHEEEDSCVEKKQRVPTFNQLTAPYHEPFCLDIHITKGSVRASIIHRATSKVVAVAHSISKDMKFDMSSCKNRSACVAVGEVLARRALEDDIHNAVYTPRRGEKLEGKLQVVLKSIIDGGICVKVKLKQIKLRKAKGLTRRRSGD